MSMTLTYGTVAVSLDGERAPDQNFDISFTGVGGVRRNYLGAAKVWHRYRKFIVTFEWTGITSAVLGSLAALADTAEIVTGSGFDLAAFGSSAPIMYSDRLSWDVQPSGLNSYDATLRLEQI